MPIRRQKQVSFRQRFSQLLGPGFDPTHFANTFNPYCDEASRTIVTARILPVEHVSRENLPGTADPVILESPSPVSR